MFKAEALHSVHFPFAILCPQPVKSPEFAISLGFTVRREAMELSGSVYSFWHDLADIRIQYEL